ncbi:hypothetical protein KKD37_04705 [Patescibacteria group bacterium]|nr:hypothetical protein [Patescibacteria group bacterium]
MKSFQAVKNSYEMSRSSTLFKGTLNRDFHNDIVEIMKGKRVRYITLKNSLMNSLVDQNAFTPARYLVLGRDISGTDLLFIIFDNDFTGDMDYKVVIYMPSTEFDSVFQELTEYSFKEKQYPEIWKRISKVDDLLFKQSIFKVFN